VRYRSDMAEHARLLQSKIMQCQDRYFAAVAKSEERKEDTKEEREKRKRAEEAKEDDLLAPAKKPKEAVDAAAAAATAAAAESASAAAASSPEWHPSAGTRVEQLLQSRMRFESEYRAHLGQVARVEEDAARRRAEADAARAREAAQAMAAYQALQASNSAAAGTPQYFPQGSPQGAGYGQFPGTPQPQHSPMGLQHAQHVASNSNLHGMQAAALAHLQAHASPQHPGQRYGQSAQPSPAGNQPRLSLPPLAGSYDPLSSAAFNPYS
jgi:hypothetical protein